MKDFWWDDRITMDEIIYYPALVATKLVFMRNPLLIIQFCSASWVLAALSLILNLVKWISVGLFALPFALFTCLMMLTYLHILKRRDEVLRDNFSVSPQEMVNEIATEYAYLIRDGEGLIKIGKAKDPQSRLRELSTGASSKLEILHLIPSERALRDEKALHRTYREKRVRGEWFRLTDEDIEHIKNTLI